MPAARHIEGPILELRPPRSRFLYVIKGRRIIVLVALRKQKGETPPREIKLAFRRLAEVERREAE